MKFECKMKDGSVYKMPNEKWQQAYDMKYSQEDQREIKKIFTELAEKHWKTKTVPTKFGTDAKWGTEETKKKYKNHADLEDDIMYVYIRAAIMGIIFSELSGGRGKVIGISNDRRATI